MITNIVIVFHDGSRETFKRISKEEYGKALDISYTRSETTVTIIENYLDANAIVEHVFERAHIRNVAITTKQEA